MARRNTSDWLGLADIFQFEGLAGTPATSLLIGTPLTTQGFVGSAATGPALAAAKPVPTVLYNDIPDIPGDTSTTVDLIIGGTNQGNVSTTDQDWFRVSLVDTETLSIVMREDVPGPATYQMALHDASGTELLRLNSVSTDGNLYFRVTPGEGDYFVSVTALSGSGDYTLTSSSVLDDFAADETTTGLVIVDGDPIQGVIETSGDVDWIAFDAVAGETIQFSYTGLLTSAGVISFRADSSVDETAQFGSDSDGASAVDNFTTDTSGRYYLVFDPVHSTNDYTIQATTLNDDFPDDATTTGVIAVDGSPIQGRFDLQLDVDWIGISVEDDQSVAFTLDGSDRAVINGIFQANGRRADGTDFLEGADLSVSFATGGFYYIAVANGEGNYTLSATSVEDDYGNSIGSATPISLDGSPVEGAIQTDTDADYFSVSLEAGQTVTVDMFYDGFGFISDGVSILDASGFLLSTFSEYTADRAGTYYVVVTQPGIIGFLNDIQTDDSYTIRAYSRPDDLEPGEYGTLALDGSATTVSLDSRFDVDGYRFTLDSEQSIVFSSDSNNGAEIRLSLFALDADGNLDFDTNIRSIDALGATLAAGDYVLEVSATQQQITTVDIRATAPEPDDFAGDRTTTGVLPLDGTTAMGTIEVSDDTDWFRIEVTEAGVYQFAVDERIEDNISFSIFNAQGGPVDFDVSIFGDGIYDFNTTGTYFVQVEGRDYLGDYAVSATAIQDDFGNDADTAEILETGVNFFGSIDYAGDLDVFSVELQAGQSIQFFMLPVGDRDVFYDFAATGIYDDTGTAIIRGFGLGSEFQTLLWEVTATQTTRIEFTTLFTNDVTGDYEIILRNDFRLQADETEFTGTDGLDLIVGNALDNTLFGLDARDVILGRDGNDLVFGGDGADFLIGGDGNDLLFGGAGGDQVNGDAGNDGIVLGAGNDRAEGGAGQDEIYGQDGDDALFGGGAIDRLYGGLGDDQIVAGAGADVVVGGDGADTLTLGSGDDTAYGENGDDVIDGGIGNDTVFGGAGNDTVFGGDGIDVLITGEGADTVSGDAGDDVIYGQAGDDSLSGGDGNDTIFASGGDVALDGGTDLLDGGAGIDLLIGDAGSDTMLGGAGGDVLYGFGGNDMIDGGEDGDTIFGGEGDDVVDGGAGDDLITGEAGHDVMDGGDGNDIVDGGAGADRVTGGAGDNIVSGGTGADSFHLTGGIDRVFDFEIGVDTLEVEGSAADLIAAATEFTDADGIDYAIVTDGTNGTFVLRGIGVDALDAGFFTETSGSGTAQAVKDAAPLSAELPAELTAELLDLAHEADWTEDAALYTLV